MISPILKLPIDSYTGSILQLLEKSPSVVLTAEPGAGKSTRLPWRLMERWGPIWITVPRRLAAVAAAARVCEELGCELGSQCGYIVRHDNRTSANTKIVFMTEAVFLKKLLQDPELGEPKLVIFDEFHERSALIDLALMQIKNLQALGYPLRLLVMSATLDCEKLKKYLSAGEVQVPGQLFPLKIQYDVAPQLLMIDERFFARVQSKINLALRETDKDILVFLPGVGEIERLWQKLEGQLANVAIHKLHGSLPLAEQRQSLQSGSRRKLILSTNVAESSVTVDGVGAVIDTGLARVQMQNPSSGFSELKLKRISRSSATQRAGRAARQFPGICWRLWMEHDELSMSQSESPEIQRIDLSEWGLYASALAFPWAPSNSHMVRQDMEFFEAPQIWQRRHAWETLTGLEAISAEGGLTEIGKKMLDLPMHPNLAAMVLKAKSDQEKNLALLISAILQERDFLKSLPPPGGECDLLARVEALLTKQNDVIPERARSIEKNFLAMGGKWNFSKIQAESLRELLWNGFSHRLCRRRKEDQQKALMIGGRGVKLHSDTLVKSSPFLILLQGQERDGEILSTSLCGFTKEEVLQRLAGRWQTQEHIRYDESKRKFYRSYFKAFFDLPLEDENLSPVDAQMVSEHLPRIFLQNFSWPLRENEALRREWERLQFLQKEVSKPEVQNLLEKRLQITAAEVSTLCQIDDEVLQNLVEEICYGEVDPQKVLTKDWADALHRKLDPRIGSLLRTELPQQLQLPNGRTIPIDYGVEDAPRVESKLQDFFGWKETPRIFFGRISICLHLLAPNRRPVQVTRSLSSFWAHSYAEVRKELKGRYPKHPWPENPAEAPPLPPKTSRR